jgi:hypothetical protein
MSYNIKRNIPCNNRFLKPRIIQKVNL